MLGRREPADRLCRQRRHRSGRCRGGRATRSAANGNATCRELELLPRLPCRCAAAATRCPACGSPRLLRHGELATLAIAHVDCDAFYATIEKRDDPAPGRGAGHRRRRPARRRRRGVLRRPHLRREIGDADVRGVATVPAGTASSGPIWTNIPGRPRSAPDDAGADAACRTAVDRRGFPRSLRHRAAARHVARQGAGALCPRGRDQAAHHRLDRPVLQQIPRQGRLRPRQAAGLCGARRERSAGVPGAEAGQLHLRRRQGERGAVGARRLPPHRRSATHQRDRADAPLRRGRPPPGPACARHRCAHGQRRSRNQERVLGDDVRPRHRRISARSSGFCGLWRRKYRRG